MFLRLIVFISVLLNTGPHTSNDNEGNKICWASTSELSWEDFEARASLSSKHAAMTNIEFSYKFPGSKTIKLTNCFVKNKSWVKKDKKLPDLLKHEQYHFHLSEVYARKMRQAIIALKQPTSEKIEMIFDNYYDKYTEAQKIYDRETEHSIEKAEQIKWQNKIDMELEELKLFQSPIIFLSD